MQGQGLCQATPVQIERCKLQNNTEPKINESKWRGSTVQKQTEQSQGKRESLGKRMENTQTHTGEMSKSTL
jgi:hypothetical protein